MWTIKPFSHVSVKRTFLSCLPITVGSECTMKLPRCVTPNRVVHINTNDQYLYIFAKLINIRDIINTHNIRIRATHINTMINPYSCSYNFNTNNIPMLYHCDNIPITDIYKPALSYEITMSSISIVQLLIGY